MLLLTAFFFHLVYSKFCYFRPALFSSVFFHAFFSDENSFFVIFENKDGFFLSIKEMFIKNVKVLLLYPLLKVFRKFTMNFTVKIQ